MASSSKRLKLDDDNINKNNDEDESVSGFIHKVSDKRVAVKSRHKLFNAVIQVSRDNVVVFAAEKRTIFLQAEKNRSPVKLTNIKRRVSPDGSAYDVQCGRATQLCVVTSLGFPFKDPPDSGKKSIQETLSMAPKQLVAAVEVKLIRASAGTESVDFNGTLVETQSCYIQDQTGIIKLQVWETMIGKLIQGSSYRISNLSTRSFQGKPYLTTTRFSGFENIAALTGLESETEFTVDEGEVTTVVAKISAIEASISQRCPICQAWQVVFECKKKFHRCGRCNKLQSVGSFQPHVKMSLNLVGKSEEVTVSNTVIKKYLIKAQALHLLTDAQDLEEHFMETESFEMKIQDTNIIEINKVVSCKVADPPVEDI